MAGMTRKHFIEMAGELKKISDYPTRHAAALAFSAVASKSNPRFNQEHFMAVVHGQKDLMSRPARTRGKGAVNPAGRGATYNPHTGEYNPGDVGEGSYRPGRPTREERGKPALHHQSWDAGYRAGRRDTLHG